MTIDELLDEITAVFKKNGIEFAENEAKLLVCHVLSCNKTYLYLHRDDYVEEKILLASAALINERCEGRPLAYILGSANFYGFDITVDERVLIPRPETEVMTAKAIEIAKNIENPRILDLCTGSGCISLALAENLPNARISASDISLKALQLARYNLKGQSNVEIIKSDLFDNIEGEFDLIISNPPYVAEKNRSSMQREVVEFEPELALFSGEDGLDLIQRLLSAAPKYLKDGGVLLMEHSEEQSESIRDMCRMNFSLAETLKDLAGHDRFLLAKKK